MQNLKTETDEQLVKLYEDGNDAAFDVLLDRYQKSVYGYILTIVCDVDRADDIFQDTFFKAIHYIRSHRYVDSGKFQAWLIRIARNLICDTHRRKAPIVDIADEKERARVMENPTMAVGSIEDDLHNAQTVSDLTSMITYLPEPQQEVVRMRIFENRSFKEIAQLTNCSINTALGRMRYAVINLRRMAATRDLTLVEYD
ncbi:MAG: sigma-70 family RNA polymerase sigma factor [Bacteroidaceae bacterium]|nr:sigma-70 family RNA polymerase sigma factor [Bacteroidaceae bacterium]